MPMRPLSFVELVRSAKAEGKDHVVGGDWEEDEVDEAIAGHREVIAAAEAAESLHP